MKPGALGGTLQLDIFGSQIQETSFEDEYKEYISSSKWKFKREQALHRANYKCERCGCSKWTSKLEVHHKTYDNFKHEKLEDLEVVCANCHKKADDERRERVERERRARQAAALYNARLEGWAQKVHGEYWYIDENIEFEFDQWLEDKGYDY